MLLVITVIGIMFVLLAPALNPRKSADELTLAAYKITDVLQQARMLALSRNTYVWVGFYEEDPASTAPTAAKPPYSGKGRVIIATVYSNDGTDIIYYTASAAPLPSSRITQFGRLIKIENIHLTDIGKPGGSTVADSLDARSAQPYESPVPNFSSQNRISSDTPDATKFQFSAGGYTFWKTVRFSPRGEARINTSYDYRRVAEIGIKPTRGNSVDTKKP